MGLLDEEQMPAACFSVRDPRENILDFCVLKGCTSCTAVCEPSVQHSLCLEMAQECPMVGCSFPTVTSIAEPDLECGEQAPDPSTIPSNHRILKYLLGSARGRGNLGQGETWQHPKKPPESSLCPPQTHPGSPPKLL